MKHNIYLRKEQEKAFGYLAKQLGMSMGELLNALLRQANISDLCLQLGLLVEQTKKGKKDNANIK